MTMPRMIFFDYGGTLLYEPNFDPAKVNSKLLDFVVDNHGVTAQEYNECATKIFDEIRACSGGCLEVNEHLFLRYMADYFKFEFSAPIEQIEQEMFDTTECRYTPSVREMLRFLRDNGIKTGVVSNLCWSGQALKKRLRDRFPEHNFDLVITSSDFFFRKPSIQIFESAIRKSGFDADEIWFCGNSLKADVIGAHNAGLFPVWYNDSSIVEIGHETGNSEVTSLDFEYLQINSWTELMDCLTQHSKLIDLR